MNFIILLLLEILKFYIFCSKLHDQHLVTKLNETDIQISQVFIQAQTNENDRELKQIMLIWPEEVCDISCWTYYYYYQFISIYLFLG